MAVAELDGFTHRRDTFLTRHLVGAQTKLWHLAIIIKRDKWDTHGSIVHEFRHA